MRRANDVWLLCNICTCFTLITASIWMTAVPTIHSMTCQVDTLGWFGPSRYNITLHDTSPRRMILSCLDIQQDTVHRIMEYRSRQLTMAIRRRQTIQRARDGLVLAPCHVVGHLADTVAELAALVKTVASAANQTAGMVENTVSILSRYTLPVVALLYTLYRGAPTLQFGRDMYTKLISFRKKKVDI